MKRGFTMIELIFVIVILGILAAVAIPRLSATRDDAVVARSVSDIATAIQDIGAHYTARGDFNETVGNMTNVQFPAATGSGPYTTSYAVGTTTDCVRFTWNVGSGGGDLNVSNTTGATGPCFEVQGLINQRGMNKVHQFGGSRINF